MYKMFARKPDSDTIKPGTSTRNHSILRPRPGSPKKENIGANFRDIVIMIVAKLGAPPRERDRSQNPDRAAIRRRRPEVADDGDRRRHEGRLDEVGGLLRARDLDGICYTALSVYK